jgi:hypothetical protein
MYQQIADASKPLGSSVLVNRYVNMSIELTVLPPISTEDKLSAVSMNYIGFHLVQ